MAHFCPGRSGEQETERMALEAFSTFISPNWALSSAREDLPAQPTWQASLHPPGSSTASLGKLSPHGRCTQELSPLGAQNDAKSAFARRASFTKQLRQVFGTAIRTLSRTPTPAISVLAGGQVSTPFLIPVSY